ncbi:hypothetical protein N7489_003306 [Penicillium chrysogenum]|jgi:hypothetical protein|uniref:F-box domain-containing protein n=1 Tax=Penicillium chrysogenum TaxID=5076 RepID=A0ABQ8W874_PENCH|nr:uncharacterized protein N7489_003306 [Penicillium chrysogenum]KAJ5252896.1 hypothetical protein N7489_003306 [Penicillium chrysogenum]KAJ5253953.1 hypothetical protein N7524_011133 [Penicillium chrysogenum]KAJ5260124.1 hypothetical protein N7505_009505 [Penicillium chrysogenum]KAJ6141952.1 hypothetical protein N7497_011051 [Penicillium chrysogenum]
MSPPTAEDETVTRTKLATPNSASSSHSSAVPKSKRRPGRVFKKPIRSSSSRSSRSSRSRSSPYDRPSNSPRPGISRPHTPRRVLSLLEALPVEIIEQIFLHSLNLNFPRASPFLSRALSGEHIYRALILLAFWNDALEHPRSKVIDRMMVPLDYVPLKLDERARLQEAVFKCKWCTVDRVREQIPTMQILTIYRRWINAGIKMDKEEQVALEKLLAREDDSVRIFHGTGGPMKELAQMPPECFEMAPNALKDSHEYKLHVIPMVTTELHSVDIGLTTNFPALDLCKFPPHLLRGRSNGFLPEDVAFLEMLRMTSCNWTPPNSSLSPTTLTQVDRKALNEGIQNAIRHQNLNAMISLLKIDEFLFRYRSENKGRGVYYTIPSEHFLAVTRTGRDKPQLNLAFFEALLRASAESLPSWSSEITKWAVDNMELERKNPNTYNQMNGKLARWLSNFVLRLPAQVQYAHDFPAGQLFCNGQLDVLNLEGCRFVDEVLDPFRQPFGNWMTESSFRTEDHWLKKFGPSLPP